MALSIHVNTTVLKEALDVHKHNLVELKLTNGLDRRKAWTGQPRVGDFQDYTALPKLMIDEQLLRKTWRSLDFNTLLPHSCAVLAI